MTFNYEYYKKEACTYPIVLIIFFGIIFIVCFINTLIAFFNKKVTIANKLKLIFVFFLALSITSFSMIYSIGRLNYGKYLINETQDDALEFNGTIEKIEEVKNPLAHTYKYAPIEFNKDKMNAHLMTISGKTFYFMIKWNLEVGDKVKIIYLPKSTMVLEVAIEDNIF